MLTGFCETNNSLRPVRTTRRTGVALHNCHKAIVFDICILICRVHEYVVLNIYNNLTMC